MNFNWPCRGLAISCSALQRFGLSALQIQFLVPLDAICNMCTQLDTCFEHIRDVVSRKSPCFEHIRDVVSRIHALNTFVTSSAGIDSGVKIALIFYFICEYNSENCSCSNN
jgi:hypothetical protein